MGIGMKSYILAALLIMPLATKAQDVTAEFSKCAITKDDSARLACYDGLRDRFAKQSAIQNKNYDGYKLLDLADLKVDIDSLKGQKVAVSTNIQTVGDISMLKGDAMDMSPVFAVTKNLPRSDRKKILSDCESDLCEATFYGVIKQADFGPALYVEKVVWQ